MAWSTRMTHNNELLALLALDGGGIRGDIIARTLADQEQKTGRRTADVYDMIAGTSTGGIIACMLAGTEATAEDLVRMYEGPDGKKIFSRSTWHRIKTANGMRGPKYPAAGIEEVLRKYLGDKRLSDCVPDIIVPAYDTDARSAVFFKSRKAMIDLSRDYPLFDVAMATSAAPTYFSPHRLGRMALIDGGVYANNPAMCGIAEMRKINKHKQLLVVSIGTGELTRRLSYKRTKSWGLIEWAPNLLNCILDGQSDATHYQASRISQLDYFRLQCKLTIASDKLDNVSDKNILNLKEQAEQMIADNKDDLVVICKLLTLKKIKEIR